MSQQIVRTKTYLTVFLALIFLTGLTTAADYVDMGRMNVVVALAIATMKAILVALFFMHLRYTAGLTRVVMLAGLLLLGALVTGTLADSLTRSWSPVPTGWGPAITLPSQP